MRRLVFLRCPFKAFQQTALASRSEKLLKGHSYSEWIGIVVPTRVKSGVVGRSMHKVLAECHARRRARGSPSKAVDSGTPDHRRRCPVSSGRNALRRQKRFEVPGSPRVPAPLTEVSFQTAVGGTSAEMGSVRHV
jgi:hypothetical protein